MFTILLYYKHKDASLEIIQCAKLGACAIGWPPCPAALALVVARPDERKEQAGVKGVRSLKFLTPTPLLLRLNIL